MTLEQFDKITVQMCTVLNTFKVGKFHEETKIILAKILSELSVKKGKQEFIDALIQLEQNIKEYFSTLPAYKKDFNKARDPYKEILVKFCFRLINILPYSKSNSMQLLSKVVGFPWS